VRDEGFRSVVLLGMGGSSLGPEVLRQTFGSARGYPELIVLDSVLPEAVRAVSESIDLARTLFLVSSKSGTTIEPLLLLRYFKAAVESACGTEKAGQNFVAITDPETPLAEQEGFRRIFLNPPDIGGRYSVLSYFGLVPAALIGIDIEKLLDRADRMREACASCVPTHENPGAWLGVTMGTMAMRGLDKLTLITSPAINSFGLWVEQLVAESTGKEGRGIIPVADEPVIDAEKYGDDRLFVYLRMNGDDNSASDKSVESIKSSVRPVLVLELHDIYDLGAEFFRWEFAVAVAGQMLGINPFDQPDVQSAKDATQRLLQDYLTSNHLPEWRAAESPTDLLSRSGSGKYLAIMAYVLHTPEIDKAVSDIRRKILDRYSVATTFGYGPRFLHSTGQLHKGGPDSGLFLQLTADHDPDLSVPGEPYTFGVAGDAQALGDLEALQSLGRRVASVHLDSGNRDVIIQAIEQLLD
jgi:glucose-6-phosphate isomerase/transaldolase/glucose-6-phosphate isomerase